MSTIGRIVIPLVCILLLAWSLLPSLKRAKEQARKARCMGNLMRIRLHLKQYALDHDDVFPWEGSERDRYYRFFGKLHPKYADDLEVFQCPSSTDKVMQVKYRRIPKGLFKESECRSGLSYAYGHNQGEPWTEEAPSTTSIAADKYTTQDYTKDPFPKGRYPNHWKGKIQRIGGGRNVVRVDGSVRWDDNTEFLEADYEWDVKVRMSVTNPEYEPDEDSDPEHDQTGPDWWSDPPDK